MFRRAWRWLCRKIGLVERVLVLPDSTYARPLLDSPEVLARLAPASRYRVELLHGNAVTALYQGPFGAHARQVFEQVQPKSGETLRFLDSGVCRGEKT